MGVFAGGYISDLVVTKLGVHSRLWLLGTATVSQNISRPECPIIAKDWYDKVFIFIHRELLEILTHLN